MNTYVIPIVGLPHHDASLLQKHADILVSSGFCLDWMPIVLEPEPGNAFDPHAVKVLVDPRGLEPNPMRKTRKGLKPLVVPTPFQIGFIRKAEAEEVSSALLAGVRFESRLHLKAADSEIGKLAIPASIWPGLIRATTTLKLKTAPDTNVTKLSFLPATNDGPQAAARPGPRRRNLPVAVWI